MFQVYAKTRLQAAKRAEKEITTRKRESLEEFTERLNEFTEAIYRRSRAKKIGEPFGVLASAEQLKALCEKEGAADVHIRRGIESGRTHKKTGKPVIAWEKI